MSSSAWRAVLSLGGRSYGPIGLDIGATSLKMIQLTRDGGRIVGMGRRDLPLPEHDRLFGPERVAAIVQSIDSLRRQYPFRGRQVVAVLNDRQLFIQNIRVPRVSDRELDQLVTDEIAERLPYPIAETSVRYHCAGEVRQGERSMREVIVFAAANHTIDQTISIVDQAGLQACALETEPGVLVRGLWHEFRRAEDRNRRTLLVHVGATRTAVIVVDARQPLLVKYLAIGGRQFDQAVAQQLDLDLRAASSLRRHHGDRRADRRDPEVAATVAEAIRPITEKLISELAMCTRYYSVTFRGRRIDRLVLGGGEATEDLAELIGGRLHLPASVSQPLRHLQGRSNRDHAAAWNVAVGAALRGCHSVEEAVSDAAELEGAPA